MAYGLQRSDTGTLFTVWTILFALYAFVISRQWSPKEVQFLLIAAFIFRFLFLFSIPGLSDDFYRFIWDGRLSVSGISPYSTLPSAIMEQKQYPQGINNNLFSLLNSPHYYSVYPTLLQGIFWIAAKISPGNILGSVVVMRLFIIAAEFFSLTVMLRMLKSRQHYTGKALIYLLNPLIITELTGNLHFEAVMICLMLWGLYLLESGRWQWCGVAWALAICTKMIPLLFLPMLCMKLGLKRSVVFITILCTTVFVISFPFFNLVLLQHMFNSVALYFRHFEFNASVFYLIRGIGFHTAGYDVINIAGKVLALSAACCILAYTWYNRKREGQATTAVMLVILFIYYALALVVHPWYLSTLVVFGALTTYRFPLVWSFLVGFTYFTYHQVPYAEHLTIVFIEYAVVTAVLIYELYNINKRSSKQRSLI